MHWKFSMKRVLIVLVALATFPGTEFAVGSDIFAANAKLGAGVNLGNALEAPAEGEWGVTLKPEYFRLIREAGFDAVRLPIRWSAHVAEQPPYTIDPKFFERVDWAIAQAVSNGLNIVINAHHDKELDEDPAGNIARFTAIWEQIASRYRDQPPSVFFEIYNEPHDNLDAPAWNKALVAILRVIRRTNPTRPVVIGPVEWNSIRALGKLQLPAADHNIIVTVHYYEPFHFTHQGASWVEGSENWLGRTWDGDENKKQAVRKSLETAAEWGRRNNRPIFLGEYGVYSKADDKSRARWTRFVSSEASRLGFSRAYWEFCSGFGLFDPDKGEWRETLKAAALAAPN